jgi:hypothetical protein
LVEAPERFVTIDTDPVAEFVATIRTKAIAAVKNGLGVPLSVKADGHPHENIIREGRGGPGRSAALQHKKSR